MEGDGDLMKMLMRADPPDESIQGPMDESALVQSGGYPQTGMAFGSGSYAGMQQQFTGISSRQQQQQQCNSGYPPMNPGQMIPRSPNNGMMQPDMDLMLQQQQYQQQQQQQPPQSAYGSGNYQGYNGGYQGARTVSPQTHSQAMSPYQGGFPPDSGYAPGGVSGQSMGEFGPQAGPTQPMGMPGPASLSLAAMSNRQQYYADGYGMSQPVSPVQKQMPQGGGFLQPSGMPYSQQVPYQPSPYPKRPSSSPVPSQMHGFSSAGSSYTPRSTTGMQLPNMSYTSPTNPYQPPCSPGRRSSSTSPVPQQDAGMYNRPQEHFPQPRSPFGTSQGHFQQQQQQQQPTHSSCMFVQPSITPSQSHYQSQQLMTASKAGGLTQRRASYPGHQNAVKMPSPPPKRSPPTKVSSPSATSPDLTRVGQLGFEERSSLKPFTAKEKVSSPPSSDPSSVTSEPTITVSNAVQCSFKKKSTSAKKRSETLKANPRQRRSASDATSPCVSPPIVKKEPLCPDGHKNEAEETIEKEGSDKTDTKFKEIDVNESSESKSVSRQEHGQAKKSLQSLWDSKEESSCDFDKKVGNECKGDEIKAEEEAAVKTTSVAPRSIDKSETEHKEVEHSATSFTESESCARSPVKEVGKEETSHENPKFRNDDKEETCTERKEPSEGKNVDCKKESNREVEKTGTDNEELSVTPMTDSKIGDTSGTSDETNEADDQTRATGLEADKTSERCRKLDDQSKGNGKTSQTNDDETGKVSSSEGAAIACKTKKTGSSVDDACAEGVDEEERTEIKEKVSTSAKKSEVGGEVKEIESEETRITKKPEAYGKTDEPQVVSEKSSGAAEKSLSNENVDGTQDAKVHSKKDRQAIPSLRCEERLSSDDDDRLHEKTPADEKTQEESDSEGGHVVESRTLGIQTVQQHTTTTRTTQHQATPIKATIIAKGTSSQNNQQVMVAKTTNGKMYLIQGNILMPVQKLSTDSSKQNPQVIIVNPVTSGSGSNPATKGGNATDVTTGRNDGKTGNCQSNSRNKASNVSDKAISGTATMPDTEKCDQSIKNPERSPKTKTPVKKDKSPNSETTKNSPTRPDKARKTGEKDNQTDKTESPRAKNNPHSTNSNKTAETSTTNQASSVEGNRQLVQNRTRGRPVGSKDKQKRKPYVHKVKRKQEDMEVEEQNTSEPVAKRKFSKTAIAVQEMSSASGPPVACAKRLVEAPTVSVGRPSKKRKVSNSSSSVKHVMSTKPRGGVDGDTWVCSFCGRQSGFNLLGDLYGPYKTKFSKEKSMDGSSKEGKLSQKMSSPSRRASSSSDIQTDSESYDVDLWIHRDCGVWSPGVFMIGRTVHGLEQAVESAAQHKCTKCFELGATLACFKRGCNKIFHYACARDSGSSFVEDNFTIFCSIHKVTLKKLPFDVQL